MAVDLPPPITPQQDTLEHIQVGDAVATFASHDYQVHVFGAREISAARVESIVNSADTMSNGLRGLVSAHYAAGYPAAQVTYTVAGKDLYVLVTLSNLTAVEGDENLAKYFKTAAGKDPLTAKELEPRRMLASMHADRAGLKSVPAFTPEIGAGATMAMKSEPKKPADPHFSIELGNPGNRFVGRYFASLEAITGTQSGDEYRALYRTTLSSLNKDAANGKYNEGNLAWSRVTTWGIFSVGGRYTDYTFDFPLSPSTTIPLKGVAWVGEARWQYPLFADYNTRITTQAKLDRSRKSTDRTDTQLRLQNEAYNTLELSETLQKSTSFWGHNWDIESGLAVRKGLGDKSASIPAAFPTTDEDYLLFRAAFVLRCNFASGESIGLEATGQKSSNNLPEQQQLVLGGLDTLTSSLPGIAVGDTGVIARIVGMGRRYAVWKVQVRPQLFVESAYVNSNSGANVPAPATTPATVTSGSPGVLDAGGQMDFFYNEWLDATVAYAQKISSSTVTDANLQDHDANVYFRIRARF